ncbi:MAG: tRNA (N6-isopentenyl adenosine(37)-C2)-methylthiotransferase MiaB [Planctomycetes bacterium]|nr:tRNA (N6-isopentenyl adenosine(37)-C2)-methylthiotransferase MiaB [Planctomycetota bacterium]
MNKLDAELMLGALLESGYTLTREAEEAGVILYVSCSVRQHAEDRVLSKIGRLKIRKKREKDLVIGLLGCMAQRDPEEFRRRYPYVDIICGTAEFLRIPELIETARGRVVREGEAVRRGGPVLAVDLNASLEFRRRRNLGPVSYQAYVSVMRGCDQACTFCIVPKTRGPEISRPVREVVDEVKALVDKGVREVTLLGQTVNSYGKRLAPGRQIGLQHLLHELNKVSGLERLRFITSHPRFMSPDLIEAMGDLEKVCEYLHLPVQSGSDAVLRRMLRTYTLAGYRDIIDRCRRKIRNFAVATDFIVGFPGETEEDFEASCRLLEEIGFQNSFIFKYSRRPHTRAALLPVDVPEAVKQERNQRLLEIQERVSWKLYREKIGKVEEVLVEGPSKNAASRLTGRNRTHQIVVFPAPAGVKPASLAGKLLPVRIDGATALTLQGELLAAEENRPAPPVPPTRRPEGSSGEPPRGEPPPAEAGVPPPFLPIEALRGLWQE